MEEMVPKFSLGEKERQALHLTKVSGERIKDPYPLEGARYTVSTSRKGGPSSPQNAVSTPLK